MAKCHPRVPADCESRRCVRPQRVQDDEHERGQMRRQRNRVRQQRYRERQRALLNDAEGSRLAHGAPTSPPYIPAHQKDAIDEFFDRLRSVDTVLAVCSTCQESYYGIRVRLTECERCSNEVRSLLYRPLTKRVNILIFFRSAQRTSLR